MKVIRWIFLALLSLAIAVTGFFILPGHGWIGQAIQVGGIGGFAASGCVLVWTACLRLVRSLPVVEEGHVAVVTRNGRFLEVREPGRIWRWILRPILFPFDEIKTIIPRKTLVFETPIESILVWDGIEVQAKVQIGYKLQQGFEPVYRAAFSVPDWRGEIEGKVAPSTLRTVVGRHKLADLIENQRKIEQQVREAIEQRISAWGFSVAWVELSTLHLPQVVTKAIMRGMEIEAISNRLLKVALAQLKVMVAATEQGLDPRDVFTPNAVQAILGALPQEQLETVQTVLDAIDQGRATDDEVLATLNAVRQALQEMQQKSVAPPVPGVAESAKQLAEVVDAPGLDVKHRLKAVIPIIPLLLQYEAEIGLDSGVNLEAAWNKLVDKLKRDKNGT